FFPRTSAKEGQMSLKLWIDGAIGHLKNAFDQDQQATGLEQRLPGPHRLPGLRQGPDDVPLQNDVVGGAVARGLLSITTPEGHRQPGVYGFALRGSEHLFSEIDPD